jgi:predicted ATPase
LITEIAVKNFKTLRDVKIPLAPGITVLVGANNSGKSNALAVLKLLAAMHRLEDAAPAIEALGGWAAVRSKGATGPLRISVTASFQGISFTRHSELSRHAHPVEQVETLFPMEVEGAKVEELLEAFSGFLRRSSVHDLSVAALRVPSIVQRHVKLEPDGRDAAAVLDSLAGTKPSLRDAIDEAVRRAAHDVKRVVTQPGSEPGTKVLGVEERDGRVYGAEDMSDGLLLFIGLAVAAQLKATTPCILAIEEPERGIHPRRIRDLVDHLLGLTKSGVQVVLTTHSPTLLDEFRDTPESVLIFDRDEQGTHITRLSDRPDWAEQLKGAPLGELWYSGVLGGVPGR